MDECPVCLEPLSGTLVHMGCCNNRVHIQCYLPKCPLCRANLPAPRAEHVIVPVPVPVELDTQEKTRRAISTAVTIGLATGLLYFAINK